jgi:hydrogenase maturation protein HypF
MSFEGESGMLLEELYRADVRGHYPFSFREGVIDILLVIKGVIEEEEASVAVSKFFHTLIEMIAAVYEPYDMPLVLSGGVFQNKILLGLLLERFPDVLIPSLFPPNDGEIALGQIAASAH